MIEPRLAATLIQSIDTRVGQLDAAKPRTAYGVVESVNTATRTAAVYLSGDTTASGGFKYSGLWQPKTGTLVRVVIDPRGDRYIEDFYGSDADAAYELRAGRIRLAHTSEASLSSTDHAFQIGDSAGLNIVADNNEIGARNNGAASPLHLNNDGGPVIVGGTSGTGALLANGLRVPSVGVLAARVHYDNASSVLIGSTDVEPDSDFRVTYAGNSAMAGQSVVIFVYCNMTYKWGATNTDHTIAIIASRVDVNNMSRLTHPRSGYASTANYHNMHSSGAFVFDDAEDPITFSILIRRQNPATESNWTPYGNATARYVSSLGFFTVGYVPA